MVRCVVQLLNSARSVHCGSSATGSQKCLWRRSCGRRPVGVAQHRVEGAGKVVAASAARHVLCQRDQTRQQQKEEQQELQREGGAQHPVEEGATR